MNKAYSIQEAKSLFSFEANENNIYSGNVKSFKTTNKFFISGKNSLEIVFDKYSEKNKDPQSLTIKTNHSDWNGYKYLNFSIFNPEEDNLCLGVKLKNKNNKENFVTQHIIFNKNNNIFLKLSDFNLDLNNINEISFFIIRPQIFKNNNNENVKLYLDNVNLNNEDIKISDFKITENYFKNRFLVKAHSNMLSNWTLKVYDKDKLLNEQIFKNTKDPKWIITTINEDKKYNIKIEAQKNNDSSKLEKTLEVFKYKELNNVYSGIQSASERVDFYNPNFVINKYIKLNILKNERSAFQIPFISNYKGELKISGLENIKYKVYKVGAIQGFQPEYLFNTNNEGYIFDVLEEIKDVKKISFNSGELNCLYIEITNNLTSDESIKRKLLLDFGIIKKDINLDINFNINDLDKKYIPKTAISTYPEFIKQFYTNNFEEKKFELYKIIGDEYIYPNNIYRGDNFTIEEINKIISFNPNVFMNLKYFHSDTDIEKSISDLKNIISYIKKKNLTNNFFFFVFDEASEKDLHKIKLYTHRLKQEFPEIKILSTNRLLLNNDIKKQLKDIDYLIPSIKDFYTDNLSDYSWFYIFIANRPPYINWYLNSDLIESRLMWWLAYKYELSGFLYYTLNRWTNNKQAIDSKDFPVLSWNPQSFEDANGDGELIYPGKENILTSLRLKNFGRGVEDYILMKMLEEKYGRNEVLNIIDSVVKNYKIYEKNPKLLNDTVDKIKNNIKDN